MGGGSSSPFSLCIAPALLCLDLPVAIETAHFCSELAVAAALGSDDCETSHCVLPFTQLPCTERLPLPAESRETGLGAVASAYRALAINEHWLCRLVKLPQFLDRTAGEEHKDFAEGIVSQLVCYTSFHTRLLVDTGYSLHDLEVQRSLL